MTRRFWFVTASFIAHAAAGVAIFAAGIWDIERLERDRRQIPSLAALMPPPPAAGGGIQLPEQKVQRKEPPKRIVTDIVQPPPKPPDDKPPTTDDGGGDKGPSKGPGPGGPDDDGTCLTPPCGVGPPLSEPPPKVDPPKPKPPEVVAVPPTTLTMMRTSGETQIEPDDVTKNAMIRADKLQHTSVAKVCVSETGSITSVTLLRPTAYASYNERLVAGIRGWKYRPHTVNGVGIKVCGTVTFHYNLSQH